MRILVAARATGLQAIDGPYLRIRDLDGMRRVAGRSAALGYDGVWCVHPGQVPVANEVFTPRQEAYDHAELVLEAYAWHTSAAGGRRGAVMLGEEMLDEASRAMARRVAAQGRAAGLVPGETFAPPVG
jgi:citrate lyase subunit beta / citryl-CoA lyase